MVSSELPCTYVLHEKLELQFDVPFQFEENIVLRALRDDEVRRLVARTGDDVMSYHFGGWQKRGGTYIIDPQVKNANPIYGLEVHAPVNVHALASAFMISERRLLPSLSLTPSGEGWAPDQLHNIYQYKRLHENKKRCVTRRDMEKIAEHYLKISSHGPNPYPPISYYEDSLTVPYGSQFWVIALCSILERALVRTKERSIGEAIARKASFLQEYYGSDTDPRFVSGNKQEMWKKLYDWRSKFVHGGFADFSKNGEFQCLKSLEEAKSILDSGVREILRILATDAEKWTTYKEI